MVLDIPKSPGGVVGLTPGAALHWGSPSLEFYETAHIVDQFPEASLLPKFQMTLSYLEVFPVSQTLFCFLDPSYSIRAPVHSSEAHSKFEVLTQ